METYEKWDIQELPLSTPFFRRQVERFLETNGLRMEALDAYFTLQAADGRILAGAGLRNDILKCLAVAADVRSEGLMVPLVSRIVSVASSRGIHHLKVFTKPTYQAVFESLGFRLLASAPEAILLENGRGLERYCEYLRSQRRPGSNGVIIMNANPFTLGHQYLIRKASEQVDTLYVIPVKEDLSLFPYTERLAMIRASALPLSEEKYFSSDFAEPSHADATVVVLEGSDYQISAATFPTYFLKDLSAAAETQIRLDIDLYCRWIAPALDASVRFVGSEPLDALTNRYNQLLQEVLPQKIATIERSTINLSYRGLMPSVSHMRFSRCARKDITTISASLVRKCLAEGNFHAAAALCPVSTWPYLLAVLAEGALKRELDTPGKPGLVGPDGNGAHKDMDYALMQKGIAAIRPFFPQMAMAETPEALRQLGIAAEKAMLAATGGVNTHRGAIFCMGLALNAAGSLTSREMESADIQQLMQNRLGKTAQAIFDKQLTDSNLHFTLTEARQMAASAYRPLFEDWLPFYRKTRMAEGSAEQLLLLHIMSTLDDSCVVKRVGKERARQVKGEVQRDNLQTLCARYAEEGISPGGAADMLALTLFMDTIIDIR